jgi:hypothetical protein
MMHRKPLALRSLLAAALVVIGCSEPPTAPDSVLTPTASSRSASSDLSANRSRLTLPASAPSIDRVFGEFGRPAINPSDYVCGGEASPVTDVLYAELARTRSSDAEWNRLLVLDDLGASILPTYEALVFQTSATPQTFGYDGEFTQAMTKVERDVKRFWDIPSEQIQVLGMHGTMLLDTLRTARTYEEVYGIPATLAASLARAMRDSLLASPTLNGGDYAYFTFNAVSFRGAGLPDKIVMGDGILEAFAAIGFGDVAPQAIFAHEFAHQIQFENEYFDDLGKVSQAEATRFTELMADAMAAYFLTHARGAAMNQKRVEQFLSAFYQLGDCQFTNPGHHGTPNQRLRAAQFGFNVADQYQKQGHILTSQEFYELFMAEYPRIIAPDAT